MANVNNGKIAPISNYIPTHANLALIGALVMANYKVVASPINGVVKLQMWHLNTKSTPNVVSNGNTYGYTHLHVNLANNTYSVNGQNLVAPIALAAPVIALLSGFKEVQATTQVSKLNAQIAALTAKVASLQGTTPTTTK